MSQKPLQIDSPPADRQRLPLADAAYEPDQGVKIEAAPLRMTHQLRRTARESKPNFRIGGAAMLGRQPSMSQPTQAWTKQDAFGCKSHLDALFAIIDVVCSDWKTNQNEESAKS